MKDEQPTNYAEHISKLEHELGRARSALVDLAHSYVTSSQKQLTELKLYENYIELRQKHDKTGHTADIWEANKALSKLRQHQAERAANPPAPNPKAEARDTILACAGAIQKSLGDLVSALAAYAENGGFGAIK